MVTILFLPAAVLVAAGLLVLRLRLEPPTVPAYLVDDAGEPRLQPGGRFQIDVRPAGPVRGAVGARAFLVRDELVRPWDPPYEVDRDGSIRIAGPVDTLFAGVPAGDWDVAVAVGRPETLPTAPRDVLHPGDADGGAAAYRVVRERIHLGS